MDVDFDELRKGFSSLEQSDLVQSINNVDQANSVSTSGYSFNVGIYNFDINEYYSQIANIKGKLRRLNESEYSLMERASEVFNRLLTENSNGDYSPELDNGFINNTAGSTLPLTKDRIILLTYNLSKGMFGQTSEEQIEYFKNNFGYGVDVYNLIMTNLTLQNKDVDKINSAYDVSFNVPVPTLSDDGRITGFEQMENKKYNKAIADMVLLNNDFFSDARNGEATYKSGETGNNVLYIYNYLVNNFGYTDTGAKAILANMMVESYVKPTTKNREGAFGLCQWLGDRRKNLETYAADNNLDINSIDTQLEFMNHELSTRWNDNRGLYASLIGEKETDFTTLTKDFCAMYEIPSDINSESIQAGYNRASYESADAVKNLIDEYVNYQPEVEVVNQYYSDIVNE